MQHIGGIEGDSVGPYKNNSGYEEGYSDSRKLLHVVEDRQEVLADISIILEFPRKAVPPECPQNRHSRSLERDPSF